MNKTVTNGQSGVTMPINRTCVLFPTVAMIQWLAAAATMLLLAYPPATVAPTASAQEAATAVGPIVPSIEHRATANSTQNMVATVHPLATEAALNALADGGNAIDAAVAAGLTLGVVDGFNSGIGGGCFILIRTADGNIIAIDGREMAPHAAHRDLFKQAAKTIEAPSRTGPLASGVPGALAAFHQANQTHGELEFSKLLLPAAEIAERGFLVTPAYQAKIESVERDLAKFPASAAVLLKQNEQGQYVAYQTGDRLIQTDLANTYRQIAEHGSAWFYNGPFARQTAEWMKQNGGILTAADFANYQTVIREPVRSTYRDYEIIGFPPPSSGGVHVAQILNVLESFDLKKLHQQDPATMFHVVGEAMKLAFADRAEWLGDPDFVNVPRGLIDQSYADQLAAKINLEQASKFNFGKPPGHEDQFFERHTTHIAAADADGNWVAITSTVNTTFGSKVIVPGLGVVMNNQMDDFVAIPDQPNAFGLVGGSRNAVEARKRPLSSMSPTIVLKNGQPVVTVGAAGGPKIITQVVNALIHHLDLGKPIDQAIAQPRIHHQWSPDVLMVERGMDQQIIDSLKRKGHEIRIISGSGICQGIAIDSTGTRLTGAADPRTSSSAGGTELLKPASKR
jgi:gamma-glutamyltranspeptidase/glutathione hydrolase